MFYPMPIIINHNSNHGGSGVEFAIPTWVEIITVTGLGLAIIGLLGVFTIFAYDLLTGSDHEEFQNKSLAICVIGIIIFFISLVLIFITGEPIE